MPIKLFRLVSNICIYSIIFGLNIYSQSNEILTGDIKESGIYHKDIVINWKPDNKEHDLHTLGIREARFSFSDIKFTYTNNETLTNAGMTFSGPNLTIKDFVIQSNIRSKNWITTEKINRLNKRERTPKEAISIIANAIDLYLMDHDSLPSDLNELIIKNYISMEAPPFDDNTWMYSLHLPEKIVSKPTFLNLVPGRDPLLYDWNSRTFQVDPEKDSLYSVPLVDWKYVFKINEISQLYSSNLELILKPDTLDIELMVERALFKISGCSFTAVPNDVIDEISKIVLPDLVLEGKNIALDIKKDEIPIIHRGSVSFKIRNFEIKIPNDLKEEPEIQSMLDVMGIWNNSLMVRMLEMEVNLINQFTGDANFKFHTPFIKISINGDFSIRQNGSKPEVYLHNTEVKINPIALGMRKYIRNWEKDNGRKFSRKGATIILNVDGPLQKPTIRGY